MYGLDFLFLTHTQVTKMSVVFNDIVYQRIFHMSRRSSMRIIFIFLGIKTLDCMYEEKLINLLMYLISHSNASIMWAEYIKLYVE